MSEVDLSLNSTWKNSNFPRGKHHNKTETKTTVSVYLSKNLVEKAKKNGLNLSKILEDALSSILNYIETQKCEKTAKREGMETVGCHMEMVGRAGFEPATLRFPLYACTLGRLKGTPAFGRMSTAGSSTKLSYRPPNQNLKLRKMI